MGNQFRPDIEKIGLESVQEKRSPVACSITGCLLEFMGKYYENERGLVKVKLLFRAYRNLKMLQSSWIAYR